MFLTSKIMPAGFFEGMWFLLQEYRSLFIEGVKYTIIISLLGTIFGLLLAIIFTPLKIQTITKRDSTLTKTLKYIGKTFVTWYVEILRGTPMMVQAVVFYYGLMGIGIDLTIEIANIITIPGIIVTGILIVSINTSAYIIEVLRGSIEAIDKGQMEAARSIGMTRRQAMLKIIIPQALRNSVPAIGNEFVINIKDTSVLSAIAVTELFYMTKAVNSIYYRQTEGYFIAAIIYLILTLLITRILYWISSLLSNPKTNKTRLSIPTSQSFTGGK